MQLACLTHLSLVFVATFKLQLMVGILSFCWDEDVHKAFQAVFAHTGQFSNYPVFTKFKLTHFKWLLSFSLMYEKKSYGKREFHEMGGEFAENN